MRFAIKKHPPGQAWEYTIDTDIPVPVDGEKRVLVILVNTGKAPGGHHIGIYSRREDIPHDIDVANLARLPPITVRRIRDVLALADDLAVGMVVVL
jgi:hypothetical protein